MADTTEDTGATGAAEAKDDKAATSEDDKRRQFRSDFDAVNQTSKDTRQRTRDLYAGRDTAENERWGRRDDSTYVNEVGENDSSGG